MGVWEYGSAGDRQPGAGMMVERFEDLRVYQQAFSLSMRVFDLSCKWPPEELYVLTSQIRRSSRSVSANIAEAWRKRRYVAHFVSKLSDADAEAGETQNWLNYAIAHRYITKHEYDELYAEYDVLMGGLVKMMSNPKGWCGPSNMVREDHGEYNVGEQGV